MNPSFILLSIEPIFCKVGIKSCPTLTAPVTACAKFFPTVVAISSNLSALSDKNLSKSPNWFFNSSKKPASSKTFLKLNILSPIIERVPANVCANSSVAFPNLPPLPNTFSNACTVSSIDTVAPALKPSIFLTPFSLNKSAEPIPALNDLCICSEAVLKSNPVTEATLPVISNIFWRSSALSVTVANIPDPDCISSNEKGTLDANLTILSKAFAPSFVSLSKNFNLVLRFSSSFPVLTRFLTTNPAPIPTNALWTLNIDCFKTPNLVFNTPKACLVLSFANILITKFCAIIYALL